MAPRPSGLDGRTVYLVDVHFVDGDKLRQQMQAWFAEHPIVARQFIDRGGFDTKEKWIQWIHDHATMPAGIYWDDQLIQNYIHGRALKGEEPYATHLKAADDKLIPMFLVDEIEVVVVGGKPNGYRRIMGSNYDTTTNRFHR
jgi:hypothetical protein